MADTKISSLTSAAALDGSEITPVNQGGVTVKATLVQIKTFVNSVGSAGPGVFTTVTASTSITTPIIDSGSTGSLSLKTNSGQTGFRVDNRAAAAVNFIAVQPFESGSGALLSAVGADTNIDLVITSAGNKSVRFFTGTSNAGGITGLTEQFSVLHTNFANHLITVTGSNGSNPVIDVTGGALKLSGGTSDIQWGKANVALGGGAAPTVGTIGGSGPAAAGQRNWLRFLESDGTASFIPVWR